MLEIANSQKLRTVNFIVGFALLVMLFPKHGHPPEKPAGVRTAIELVGKKQSALRSVTGEATRA
jgi:tryptophan 2,3-dioxygenase